MINRTALIPLGIFLVVLVLATMVVAHYEKVFVENTIINRAKAIPIKENGTVFDLDEIVIKSDVEPSGKRNLKPEIYASLLEVKSLLVEGKVNEVENMLKTLLVFYPNNVEIMSMLSGVYSVKGEYNSAEYLLNRIMKLEPENYVASENLGIILEKKSDFKSAVASFFRSSLIKPDSALSYLHMSKLYSLLNNNSLSIEYLNKAYEILGNNIFPFLSSPAFNNIRNTPEFIKIYQGCVR